MLNLASMHVNKDLLRRIEIRELTMKMKHNEESDALFIVGDIGNRFLY